MNVKFYSLGQMQAWTASYEGIFVHLTTQSTVGTGDGAVTYKPGLYFGGHSGWEYLTNDTDVANIQTMINNAINGLDVSAFAQASIVNSAAATTEGGTFTVNGISETDGEIATDADTNKTTLTAGRGLSIYNATIGHTNSYPASTNPVGRWDDTYHMQTIVTELEWDAYGHITGVSEQTLLASNIACNPVITGGSQNVQGALGDLQNEITSMATGMIYKGAYPSTEPATGNKVGDTYTVATTSAGFPTIHSKTVEEGDTIVVSGVNSNGAITDIVVIERNLDGAVTTADTLTSDKIVLGNGSKTVKTSTYGITSTAVAADGSGANTDILTSDAVVTTIANKISNLDGTATIATESNGVVTIKAGVTEADGIIDNSAGTDITLAKVATTGLAEDVDFTVTNTGITPTEVGGTTATVQEAITQLDSRITSAGITIDGQVGQITTGNGITTVTSSSKVLALDLDTTNANGLYLSGNTDGSKQLAMHIADESTTANANFGTVKVTNGNGLTISSGVISYAHNTTPITIASLGTGNDAGIVTITSTLTPDASDTMAYGQQSIVLAKVATTGAAEDVSYAGAADVTGSEPTTVEGALDDLYSKVSAVSGAHTTLTATQNNSVLLTTSTNAGGGTNYNIDLVWETSLPA